MRIPFPKREFHPLADGLPVLNEDQMSQLVEDIKQNGQRVPILLYEDKILDGRHRYLACTKLNIAPSFEDLERKHKKTNALSAVVSLNLSRRHLNETQRAQYAASLIELAKKMAKEKGSIEPFTINSVAKLLNIGRESVKRAKAVKERGSKRLKEAVQNGEVSLSTAAAATVLSKKKQYQAATTKTQSKLKLPPITEQLNKATEGRGQFSSEERRSDSVGFDAYASAPSSNPVVPVQSADSSPSAGYGQICYEAFAAHRQWKKTNSQALAEWDKVEQPMRASWDAAAEAVILAYENKA